jgi:SAM-dependent methyltransferase
MHGGERVRMPLVADRHAWLERVVGRATSEVAHIGCADSPYTAELLAAGRLLHPRLVEAAAPRARLTGIDVDADGLRRLGQALPDQRFLHRDITRGVRGAERGRYELVIAGEVLEHVPDAERFLRACGQLLQPGGTLILTVPNACCPKLGLRALLGRESVHPDHHAYYSPRTLIRVLDGAGFELTWMASCWPPAAGTAGRALINPLLTAVHRVTQGPVGDGLIAVARARSNPAAIAS